MLSSLQGSLVDGRIIDTSLSRDPLVIELGQKQVIPGMYPASLIPFLSNLRPSLLFNPKAALEMLSGMSKTLGMDLAAVS